jgi:hypothetical protein
MAYFHGKNIDPMIDLQQEIFRVGISKYCQKKKKVNKLSKSKQWLCNPDTTDGTKNISKLVSALEKHLNLKPDDVGMGYDTLNAVELYRNQVEKMWRMTYLGGTCMRKTDFAGWKPSEGTELRCTWDGNCRTGEQCRIPRDSDGSASTEFFCTDVQETFVPATGQQFRASQTHGNGSLQRDRMDNLIMPIFCAYFKHGARLDENDMESDHGVQNLHNMLPVMYPELYPMQEDTISKTTRWKDEKLFADFLVSVWEEERSLQELFEKKTRLFFTQFEPEKQFCEDPSKVVGSVVNANDSIALDCDDQNLESAIAEHVRVFATRREAGDALLRRQYKGKDLGDVDLEDTTENARYDNLDASTLGMGDLSVNIYGNGGENGMAILTTHDLLSMPPDMIISGGLKEAFDAAANASLKKSCSNTDKGCCGIHELQWQRITGFTGGNQGIVGFCTPDTNPLQMQSLKTIRRVGNPPPPKDGYMCELQKKGEPAGKENSFTGVIPLGNDVFMELTLNAHYDRKSSIKADALTYKVVFRSNKALNAAVAALRRDMSPVCAPILVMSRPIRELLFAALAAYYCDPKDEKMERGKFEYARNEIEAFVRNFKWGGMAEAWKKRNKDTGIAGTALNVAEMVLFFDAFNPMPWSDNVGGHLLAMKLGTKTPMNPAAAGKLLAKKLLMRTLAEKKLIDHTGYANIIIEATATKDVMKPGSNACKIMSGFTRATAMSEHDVPAGDQLQMALDSVHVLTSDEVDWGVTAQIEMITGTGGEMPGMLGGSGVAANVYLSHSREVACDGRTEDDRGRATEAANLARANAGRANMGPRVRKSSSN